MDLKPQVPKTEIHRMQPKRILLTRTDRLGDVVLSTPVIRFLRNVYPDAYIAFMVRPENRDVVANNPYLDEIIVYDKYGSQKSFVDTVKFALQLRKKRFDMAMALHPTNRVHLMLFLAGILTRIGYDRKMGGLLTKKITHNKQKGEKHESDYNFDLLNECGFDTSQVDRMPYMITSNEEKAFMDSVFADYGIGNNVIAMHPGASCISKRWSPEKFAKVGDLLKEQYDSDIVVVGGGETEEYSGRVISCMKNKAIDLTDTLLIGELAEFLSRCKLFVSNDSGPVHVAVAVGTPVISIFGRQDPGLSPKRWGPLGQKDVFVHKDTGCEVCLAHNCEKNFVCLSAIMPDEVILAAENILGDSPRAVDK